jgi:hypothetical protein
MSDSGQGSGWVVEPPRPDAAFVSLDFADDADITPALRQALERLVRAMGGEPSEPAETEGFQVFRPRCTEQTKCDPLTARPCVARCIVECVIVSCTTYVKPTPT